MIKKRNSLDIDPNVPNFDDTFVSAKESNKTSNVLMKVFTISMIFGLTFLAGFDAYYLYQAADEGVAFVAICFIAALCFDLLMQILVTLAFSAIQFYCEVKGRPKVFDTEQLEKMTSAAHHIARQVFSLYEE